MSEFNGTGGDWELVYDEDCGEFTLWMGGAVVERHTGQYSSVGEARLYLGWYPEDSEFPEVQANCRLIAASKDLLEACIAAMRIEDLWSPVTGDHDEECSALYAMRQKFEAAISKALEGK